MTEQLRADLKALLVQKLRLRDVSPESIADDEPLLRGPLGLDSIDPRGAGGPRIAVAMMRRASSPLWITGCGTVNALGHDVESFWEGLMAGRCGIRRLDGALAGDTGLLGAAVDDPLPAPPCLPPWSRADRMALLAAEETIRQAGLLRRPDRSRVAVVIGSTTGGFREIEDYFIERARGGPAPRRRLFLLEKAGTADRIAAAFGLAGPRYTLNTACASGATAILFGGSLIRSGLADAALAGGADALARITLGGFRALRLVDPSPCRPFDRQRAGLSLGEGAGMLLVERPETAAARGAEPLAALLGGAQTSDAFHLTAPASDGAGAARALRGALEEANPIKGAIGHTLGAAGAIEAIAAIQTLLRGSIPPTVGLREPDPSLGLDLVIGVPRRGDWRIALSNSFGFGGANAVLCLGRVEA